MEITSISLNVLNNGVLVDIYLQNKEVTPNTHEQETYFFKDLPKAITGVRKWLKERLDTEVTE